MGKPDDVPQNFWQIGERIAASQISDQLPRARAKVAEAAARAMMAAAAEENEACAQVADEYRGENTAMALDALDLTHPIDLATATKAALVSGHIAAAIRKRGKAA